MRTVAPRPPVSDVGSRSFRRHDVVVAFGLNIDVELREAVFAVIDAYDGASDHISLAE